MGVRFRARNTIEAGGFAVTTATIDKSIDVDCSRHDAYDKLSRVESYAQLPDVTEVQARGENMAHFVAEFEGRREEVDLELTRVPDERLGWRSVGGPTMDSWLTFQPLDEQHTRLQLHVEYDPEQVSDRYQLSQQDVDRRAQDELAVLKSLAEGRIEGRTE